MRVRPRGTRGEGGFTLVDLLIVAMIIGIVSTIAIPHMTRAITKARAAEVLGDLNTIKVAVLNYQSDRTTWPPDRNRGVIPPGLEEYLPSGFSFTTEHYVLDYDNWSDQSQGFIGVTMITDEQQLGLQFLDLVEGNAWTNGNDKFTWVIEWTD